jgi:hypothetical protein
LVEDVVGGGEDLVGGRDRGFGVSAAALLAALLQEAPERAGEGRDHRDRVDLHEHVEDAAADRDRILDLRGDGQQLSRRPKHSAAERLDLGLLGVALEQERRDCTQQVNTHGRHDDHHELIPQPTMRDCRRAQNVTKLAGSGPQHSKQHRSIVAAGPDVGAVASNGAWAQEGMPGAGGSASVAELPKIGARNAATGVDSRAWWRARG